MHSPELSSDQSDSSPVVAEYQDQQRLSLESFSAYIEQNQLIATELPRTCSGLIALSADEDRNKRSFHSDPRLSHTQVTEHISITRFQPVKGGDLWNRNAPTDRQAIVSRYGDRYYLAELSFRHAATVPRTRAAVSLVYAVSEENLEKGTRVMSPNDWFINPSEVLFAGAYIRDKMDDQSMRPRWQTQSRSRPLMVSKFRQHG